MGAGGGSVTGCRALLAELPGRIKKTVNVELDTFCSAKVGFLSDSRCVTGERGYSDEAVVTEKK